MDKELEFFNIVQGWKISKTPKYRRFNCGKCLQKVGKAWHIWVERGRIKTELHLCAACGKQYGLVRR